LITDRPDVAVRVRDEWIGARQMPVAGARAAGGSQ
jgi:hypothetical protein